MTEILTLVENYSPAVTVLLLTVGGILFVFKLIVERTVAATFDRKARAMELSLQRRSTFEEKILTERFALVTDLLTRLNKLMTEYNRIRHGQPVPDGFKRGNEIVPLTEVYEDLEIHRLVLTEEFHKLFVKQADLALQTIKTPSDSPQYKQQAADWVRTNEEIRAHAEEVFRVSQIRW